MNYVTNSKKGDEILMKVLVICGSARKISRTRSLASYVKKYISQNNIDVSSFDMREDMLPIFTGEENQHPNVVKFKKMVEEADALFVCTPDYHSGMSGALKNALDWIGSDQTKGKVFAISAVAGGGKGGISPLNQMRTVIRGIYGLVIPGQVVVDKMHFNDESMQLDDGIKKRINHVIDEMLDYTSKLT